MAISTYGYGPYYESKIQSKEKTKKALTGQGYTPEELAGATYGELMARYKDAETRRQQETDTALREQQLGLYGRQIGGQEKAAKSAERGQAISGIATGINVLDKVGALKWGGGVLKSGAKALTGLVSPAVTDVAGAIDYSGLAGGAEDIWSGVDYGAGFDSTAYGLGDYSLAGGAEEVFTGAIGDGTVICTELYRQGLLDEKTYRADSAYGALLDDEVLVGYHFWAERVADKMRGSKLLTKIVSVFAIPWAREMSFQMRGRDKGHWLGKTINVVGIPICRFIGRLIIRGGLRWETGFQR